jgi:hypothetical protein
MPWFIHAFAKIKNVSGTEFFGYTYVVNDHAYMDEEVMERRRPAWPDETGYGTIEDAEAALGGLDLAGEPPWFIERFTDVDTGAYFYFVHDGPQTDTGNLICPTTGPGYPTLAQLYADRRLSFLHNCNRCKA